MESMLLDQVKIAIVCDWLTVYGGAERVVYEMHQLFPKAPIYTSLYNPKACSVFKDAEVRESRLRWIPFGRHLHRLFLPLMPLAFEQMDLSHFDIVLSSSHSAAKGVITKPGTLHVSYCHSPMRYVWDHSHEYQKEYKNFAWLRWFYQPFLHKIRMWDRLAAERVDVFLANSKYISRRIEKYYGRESEVIYPPVDLSYFQVSKGERSGYVAVGRLIPYKRFDLIVQLCTERNIPLKVVGTGPELKRLKAMAGPSVEFLGLASGEDLRAAYQGAKALIFPQVEDFGIVPLEAMACGTPVLAFGRGGALETVKDGVSGLFFEAQSAEALEAAVQRFEAHSWDTEKVAESVQEFASARFKAELRHALDKAWKAHQSMLGLKHED